MIGGAEALEAELQLRFAAAAAAAATRTAGAKGCMLLCAIKQLKVSAARASSVRLEHNIGSLADVAAADSGVSPVRSAASAAAPADSNKLTAVGHVPNAAEYSGVWPVSLVAFTSAPAANSVCTMLALEGDA
jgi:hypothetical protein